MGVGVQRPEFVVQGVQGFGTYDVLLGSVFMGLEDLGCRFKIRVLWV